MRGKTAVGAPASLPALRWLTLRPAQTSMRRCEKPLLRLRYRYWPDHLLGEILAKRWIDKAIPVIVLLHRGRRASQAIPGLLSPASLADTARQAGEFGLIVLGMALVMIAGGIDLSVGSMFALTNFCALCLIQRAGAGRSRGRRRHHCSLRRACSARSTAS